MHHHTHFGIYALIRNPQEQILVIKKARGPYTGLYDLPGGSPEEQETPTATLHREILEETGCTVTREQLLGEFQATFEYRRDDASQATLTHTGLIFLTEIIGIPSTVPDGHDSHGCIWLNPTPENLAKCTPFVLQAFSEKSPSSKSLSC